MPLRSFNKTVDAIKDTLQIFISQPRINVHVDENSRDSPVYYEESSDAIFMQRLPSPVLSRNGTTGPFFMAVIAVVAKRAEHNV